MSQTSYRIIFPIEQKIQMPVKKLFKFVNLNDIIKIISSYSFKELSTILLYHFKNKQRAL